MGGGVKVRDGWGWSGKDLRGLLMQGWLWGVRGFWLAHGDRILACIMCPSMDMVGSEVVGVID